MFPLPWYVVLLVSIPESFLVIILGFSLFNLKITYGKALLSAVLYGLLAFPISYINMIYGIRTVIMALITIILCIFFSRKNPWQVAAAVLSGLAIALVIQSTYAPFCFTLTSTTVHDLSTNPVLNIYFFVPEAFFLATVYFLVRRLKLNAKTGKGRLFNEKL